MVLKLLLLLTAYTICKRSGILEMTSAQFSRNIPSHIAYCHRFSTVSDFLMNYKIRYTILLKLGYFGRAVVEFVLNQEFNSISLHIFYWIYTICMKNQGEVVMNWSFEEISSQLSQSLSRFKLLNLSKVKIMSWTRQHSPRTWTRLWSTGLRRHGWCGVGVRFFE